MALSIATNTSALTAQRYLNINANASASSLAKLSSGSRVPTAKDDAAALAIGSQLRGELAGLNQAANNTSQAISLLQIADGALNTIGDILVRQQSLANQASSGQLSNSERALLDQEFDALRNEVTRIANDTNFNGTALLSGGDVLATFNEANLGNLDSNGIGIAFDTGVTADDDVFRVTYDYTNAGQDTGFLTVANLTDGTSESIDITAVIQAVTGETATDLTTNLGAGQTVDVSFASLGVTLSLDDRFDVNADFNVVAGAAVDGTSTTPEAGNITATFLNSGDVDGTELAAITGLSNDGLLSLEVDDDADDTLIFTSNNTGLEFSFDGTTFATSLTVGADGTVPAGEQQVYVRAGSAGSAFLRLDIAAGTDVTGSNGSATSSVEVDISGILDITEAASTTAQFNFRVGTGAVTADDEIQVTINAVSTTALGINLSDISTEAAAETAISAISSAITTISSRRADIGANQSRLEFAANSINVAIENTTAAQSDLLDVDVTSEFTEFTSKQVLIQAGVSTLAQANQQPALLLRLFQ